MGNCAAGTVKEGLLTAQNLGMVGQLKMTSYTDQTNKIQMFNYQSDKLHKYTYHIIDDCVVFRTEDHKKHIRAYSSFIRNEESAKLALFEVYKKHNYFKIVPYNIENTETLTQKSLWLVVRSLPEKKHHIHQKDIIKLGRQKIKIREIILEDHHLENAIIDLTNIKTNKRVYDETKYASNQPQEPQQDLKVTSVVSESESTCRICLEPGQYSNPLICACKCKGTVRYIHIICLRNWLNTRLNIERKENYIVVKWTPITCEMCKTHFKYRVFLDNVKYYTLQIPKPIKPYLVLQVVGKTEQYSKIFLFVTFFKKKAVSIGRVKTCDIQVKDPSVSRHHSNIFYDQIEKKFYLTDNQSRFGTFVYIKKNLIVNPHQKHISFQVSGELFSFEALRKNQPFSEFHEQSKYLNLIEKGNEDCLLSESQEDLEQQEEIEDEISSEEDQKQEEEIKITKNISNISSRPTALNLPENQENNRPPPEVKPNNEDPSIAESNMALNSPQ